MFCRKWTHRYSTHIDNELFDHFDVLWNKFKTGLPAIAELKSWHAKEKRLQKLKKYLDNRKARA